jgi:fatty acid desaturase
MDAGFMKWTVATDIVWLPKQSAWHHISCFIKNFTPTLVTNLVIYGVLAALGHGYLYLAWIVAYIIPYPLFIRIRALAEHAGTERTLDMFLNTRTNKAGWIARAFVAPLHVNFHIEHHVMASVPWHKLPAMHKLFRQRDITQQPPNYWEVLKLVSSANSNKASA